MTAMEDIINARVGEAPAGTDIRLTIARLYFYDFASTPKYFWKGQGRLFTPDGEIWQGTVDANGNDHHQVPALSDGRDGSAADVQLGFPYLDKPTWDALRALNEPVAGRLMTAYLCVIIEGEGLRPSTPQDYFAAVEMQNAQFSDSTKMNDAGTMVRAYGLTINAKGIGAGRSKAAARSYTDTAQQTYAAQLGVTPDYGMGFVIGLANKTVTRP